MDKRVGANEGPPSPQTGLGGRNDMSPQRLKEDHELFTQRHQGLLKGPTCLKLSSNKQEFEENLRKLGQEESPELGQLAVEEFRATMDAVTSHRQKRKHGLRGASTALQESLFVVSRFVAAYSSILDAVTEAGGPYAKIGYQTMTILLIVVVAKRKNDMTVLGHLDTIQTILPRLERWKGIYSHETLQQVVSQTYLAVIDFARAAVAYFSRFWKRVLSAVVPAVMDRLDEAANAIYVTLAKVNAETSQSLHERAKRIEEALSGLRTKTERDLRALRDQNSDLQATLEARARQDELRDQQVDEARYTELESLLRPDLATGFGTPEVENIALHPCCDLSLAKTTLQSAFPNLKEYNNRVSWSLCTHMTPARILTHAAFLQWSAATSSSLLFINGRTLREGRARTAEFPCWLSPAAIHAHDHIRRQEAAPQGTIVYLSCRPSADYHIERSADLLCMVALRLLSTRKQMLRDRFQEFRHLVVSRSPSSLRTPSPSWPSATTTPYGSEFPRLSPTPSSTVYFAPPEHHHREYNYDSPGPTVQQPSHSQLLSLLSRILGELHKGQAQQQPNGQATGATTAFILLDRVEHVDNGNLQKLMHELALLVSEDAAFHVKIVVVAETSLVERTWQKDMLPWSVKMKPERVHAVTMDQQLLGRNYMLAKRPSLIWDASEEG